jgi:hypothetical protein
MVTEFPQKAKDPEKILPLNKFKNMLETPWKILIQKELLVGIYCANLFYFKQNPKKVLHYPGKRWEQWESHF